MRRPTRTNWHLDPETNRLAGCFYNGIIWYLLLVVGLVAGLLIWESQGGNR